MDIDKLREELRELCSVHSDQEDKAKQRQNKIDSIRKLLEAHSDYEHGLATNFLEVDPLAHFLKSDMVKLGPKSYCRQKVFVRAFNDYCEEHHFIGFKWTQQLYAGPFADFGIKVVDNARKRYPNAIGNKSYTETFVIGVDVFNAEGNECDETESDTD